MTHVAADRLAAMLEARSIAVVGASDRPGSFGDRLTREALRSSSAERVHLVHPRRREVSGRPCVPSLHEVPEPVDLVLLGVPDAVLAEQLALAASRGDAGAVVFGSATGLGDRLRAAAGGLALCGAGCMGFVNVARGVRAIGYVERDPLPVGSIAMVTHSGSVFSAMLRTHRRLEYSFIVSSGQELVSTTADYLDYALGMDETRVVGLLLETMRDAPRLRAALTQAAERDVPVVALTVGGSSNGRALVDAHSGAIAGDDAAWEALFEACGVHRATDLADLTDSLEAFAVGRRLRRGSPGGGLATVHDSGAERVHVADVAEDLGVPFAPLAPDTVARLEKRLEPGLVATNPLDVWGTGADSASVFTDCLETLAADPSVAVVALAVDLAPEYDGDTANLTAVEAVAERTDKPVLVLSNLASAVDQHAATRLRAQGIPVLEGTRSGLRAIGHLLAQAAPPASPEPHVVDETRRRRWADRLDSRVRLQPSEQLELLADYGIPVVASRRASAPDEAEAAAAEIGYPVVLKTAAPDVSHKVDVDGVRLGLPDATAVRAAFADLADRLGPEVLVQPHVAVGVEVALGLVRDPLLGPLVLVASGGSLIELLGERSVALPPVDGDRARAMVDRLPLAQLLRGHRGRPACDVTAVVGAVLAVSQLAAELGDRLEAVDVNPLIVSPAGATAVDALVTARSAPDTGSR